MPRNSTGWYDLPNEMRQMLIGKMDGESKMLFFTSSPEFLMDMPRNYVKKLAFSANQIWIYDSDDSYFILDFFSFCGATEICCIREDGITAWTIIEKRPLKEAISNYFQNLVRNAIYLRLLRIHSCYFPFQSTSISHLERIEYLEIWRDSPIDLYECGFIAPGQFPLDTIRHQIPIEGNELRPVMIMIRNRRNIVYHYNPIRSPLSMKLEIIFLSN